GRGAGVHVAIGSYLAGGIDRERHSGIQPRLDEVRGPAEILLAHPLERLLNRWHHVRDRHALDRRRADPARLQERLDEQSVLVGCLLAPTREPPGYEQALPLEHADLRIGVADVGDE